MKKKKEIIICPIIFALIGIGILISGINIHQSVVEKYDCKTCSVFDDECPEGYHAEENQKCLEMMEIPWKFSIMPTFVGIAFIGIAIIIFVGELKNEKN